MRVSLEDWWTIDSRNVLIFSFTYVEKLLYQGDNLHLDMQRWTHDKWNEEGILTAMRNKPWKNYVNFGLLDYCIVGWIIVKAYFFKES